MTEKEMLEKMFNMLVMGNGGPPLPEQVRNNRKDINGILAKLKNMPKKWRSWITFAITVLTFILMTLIVYKNINIGG